MTTISLDDLVAAAQGAEDPSIPAPLAPQLGGVDPLGLRQVNFDMMDQLLPGLNNVARRVRPFVVVAWAAREAARVAKTSGRAEIGEDELRDFVDRIEVVYAWSQFLRDRNAELPGRQVLASLVNASAYRFGGKPWRQRRETRRYSTAFTAPVNYGPALKALGWVSLDPDHRTVLRASASVSPALDAFEAKIADYLEHPVFSQLGDVTASSTEVGAWSHAWSLDEVTTAEQEVFTELLMGAVAHPARRRGVALMLAATRHIESDDVGAVRAAMAQRPPTFDLAPDARDTAARWRQLQVRQLFRHTLENLLHWIIWTLSDGPMSTARLVETFVAECDNWPSQDGPAPWRNAPPTQDPVALMDRIEATSGDPHGTGYAVALADGLAFCLVEPVEDKPDGARADRLPLGRAVREASAWSGASAPAFISHVLEAWVLAQHVYWSVGRGLTDARGSGNQILRLKVVLDESGWTLAPGVRLGDAPIPTPDRLAAALSLTRECGVLETVDQGTSAP